MNYNVQYVGIFYVIVSVFLLLLCQNRVRKVPKLLIKVEDNSLSCGNCEILSAFDPAVLVSIV